MSFVNIIRQSGELFSSLLFPKRCIVCDEILSPEEVKIGVHGVCERNIYPIIGNVCMHCGRPLNSTACVSHGSNASLEIHNSNEYCNECRQKGYVRSQSVVTKTNSQIYKQNSIQINMQNNMSCITQGKALYLYKGAIKTTMYRFKYSNKREYAVFFAKKAVQMYGAWMKERGIEVIVPVPMYLPKQKRRGYNQAESFAKELAKLTGVPVADDLVKRVKDTEPLKGLNPSERKNNLKNAFQKGKSIVQYSHILVVDDIYTTGSTAQAVAKELIKQGVSHVYFMSICMGETM